MKDNIPEELRRRRALLTAELEEVTTEAASCKLRIRELTAKAQRGEPVDPNVISKARYAKMKKDGHKRRVLADLQEVNVQIRTLNQKNVAQHKALVAVCIAADAVFANSLNSSPEMDELELRLNELDALNPGWKEG